MTKKDLLIVYNIFGEDFSGKYNPYLQSFISHITESNLWDNVRLVISACLKTEKTINELKNKFGDHLSIVYYDYRLPVQVTFNKTVLTCISEYQEEYVCYLYISADVLFKNEPKDILNRLIQKNKTDQYGIIHLETTDGYIGYYKDFDFCVPNINDRNIPLGKWNNFIIGSFHKSLKDFYGVPMPDAHGVCCMEPTLSYSCSALRKKYIIMGNSAVHHDVGGDSISPQFNIKGKEYDGVSINCGLNWGRTFEKDILSDIEAIKSGIGYYPYNNNELNPTNWIAHDKNKFDDEELSIDENLKYGVKRCFYTNKNEIDYDLIEYSII